MAFNMASVFLSQRTISKVKLCKHLRYQFTFSTQTDSSDLQETIDADNLLEIHGGKMPLPKVGHELNLLDDIYSGKAAKTKK